MSSKTKFNFQLIKLVVFVLSFMMGILTYPLHADQMFPSEQYQPKQNPIVGKDASVGGELVIFAGPSTKSYNYYLDNNVLSAEITGNMFESLLTMNPINLEYEPGLASKWSISSDKKVFVFYLVKNAKWSDGKPITAHDVKWTFDAVMDPKNMTGSHKVSLERFYTPEIIDEYTISFKSKSVHWENLGAVGGFYILPKHEFEKRDFNAINFEFPVVSGLYQVDKTVEGQFMTMKRRDDWWAKDDIRNKGLGNFKTLKFMFFNENENAFEAFKKGEIDLFPIYTAHIWVNETQGEKFDKNWIVKQKVVNNKPIGFQGFAMNMRKFPFDDILVRKAMCMLLDRQKMNRTLMYDQYFLHSSYFEDLYDSKNPNPNKLIEFNKDAARELLKQAGWKVNPKNGILEKNSKPFVFNFLSRSATEEKFLNIFREDLKDVGIEMNIDKKDWAAWAKDMETFSYQMTWAAWTSSVFKDPESMWASSEAKREGGNNITGFMNPEVDKLIEEQKTIFDVQKRHEICRKIDGLLYEDYPYVLLWNLNYTRLLYWNKFGTPRTVLSKYGDERSAYFYWWWDQDSDNDLKDAIKNSKHLPPKQAVIEFDGTKQ